MLCGPALYRGKLTVEQEEVFANETAVGGGRIPNPQYDPAWAQTAWDRTLAFFGCTLWRKLG